MHTILRYSQFYCHTKSGFAGSDELVYWLGWLNCFFAFSIEATPNNTIQCWQSESASAAVPLLVIDKAVMGSDEVDFLEKLILWLKSYDPTSLRRSQITRKRFWKWKTNISSETDLVSQLASVKSRLSSPERLLHSGANHRRVTPWTCDFIRLQNLKFLRRHFSFVERRVLIVIYVLRHP